jgi:uncharacterized protein YaaN involved in tellurite resistance
VSTPAPDGAGPDPELDSVAATRIVALANGFVDAIVAADLHGDAYRHLLADVGDIGEREIVATSELSHRLVDRPMRAIIGTLDGESPIAQSLAELREAVEELDPGRLGRSGGRPRKLLGVFPLGDPVQDALEAYAKARVRIQRILGALAVGRSALHAEIAAIAQEQLALAHEIETLRQYAELARTLDERLELRLASVATGEPERAEAIRTDVLFAVRQRRRDLLIQLAVATQGDAALRVVQDNNRQVVRTIRMATTTTAAALRTSVAVAQAMADQRRILAQLASVRDSDRRGTRDTGATRPSGPPGPNPAAAIGVDLEGLKRAWDTVFATLDQFDSYSLTAIDAMRDAVAELAEEAEQSRAALEADRGVRGRTEGGLDPSGGTDSSLPLP